MRIVKQLEPVTCVVPAYDGRLMKPEEGTLLSTFKTTTRPWSCDINKRHTFSPLRLLLEDHVTS